MYGPSTDNVKIESWWRQLRYGASDRWITFAHELIDNVYFSSDVLADQVAVYAVYRKMIQDEFASFVNLWNGHCIRPQPKRLYVKSGVPMDLYTGGADVRDWGVRFEEDDEVGQSVLQMLHLLEAVNIDDFMTAQTTEWCQHQLTEMGFTGELTEGNYEQPHLQTYLDLRERIQRHITSGQAPVLELYEPLHGGREEYVCKESNQLPKIANRLQVKILQQNHPESVHRLPGQPIPAPIIEGIQVYEDEIAEDDESATSEE
jgi:hypothetical protein